jgi:acyl-CoA reductase-like NAD-dependent aldehyde dehydrogenase
VKKLQNFVNGKHVDSSSGETTTLVNPSTGKEFATAPKSNGADVDKAFSRCIKMHLLAGATQRHQSANALC